MIGLLLRKREKPAVALLASHSADFSTSNHSSCVGSLTILLFTVSTFVDKYEYNKSWDTRRDLRGRRKEWKSRVLWWLNEIWDTLVARLFARIFISRTLILFSMVKAASSALIWHIQVTRLSKYMHIYVCVRFCMCKDIHLPHLFRIMCNEK